MNGLIKVTPDSALILSSECSEYMQNFDIEPYLKTENRFIFSKMKKVPITIYSGLPHWYQYMGGLLRHMKQLKDMADNAKKTGDEIWLSELSYKNMVLLKNGNEDANPIYIMNY